MVVMSWCSVFASEPCVMTMQRMIASSFCLPHLCHGSVNSAGFPLGPMSFYQKVVGEGGSGGSF